MNLATLETKEEEQHLLEKMNETFSLNPQFRDVTFLVDGLVRDNNASYWYWSKNGNPITYTVDWSLGQPEQKINYCMGISNSGGYHLSSVECTLHSHFICEKMVDDPACQTVYTSLKSFATYQNKNSKKCEAIKNFYHTPAFTVGFNVDFDYMGTKIISLNVKI